MHVFRKDIVGMLALVSANYHGVETFSVGHGSANSELKESMTPWMMNLGRQSISVKLILHFKVNLIVFFSFHQSFEFQ